MGREPHFSISGVGSARVKNTDYKDMEPASGTEPPTCGLDSISLSPNVFDSGSSKFTVPFFSLQFAVL